MNKMLFTVALVCLLSFVIVFSGCDGSVKEKNETPQLPVFHGVGVRFDFESTNLGLDDDIVITAGNYSDEIYLYKYCKYPFGVLQKVDNYHSWVYPFEDSCKTPINETLIGDYNGEIRVPVSDIKTRTGENLEPGTYMIKIFYTTYKSGEFVRESNNEINITE